METFVGIGKVRGNDEPVARLIQRKIGDTKGNIELKEVFFTTGVIPMDEGSDFYPDVMIAFEASGAKVAERFMRSLGPDVFGSTLVEVSREPTGMHRIHSEAELRSLMRNRP